MNEFFKKPVVKILMLKGEKGDKGDTGIGTPTGGKTGQYLQKKTDADYDYQWSAITTVNWESVTGKPDAYPTTWDNVSGKTNATESASGLMSAADKSKLDNLQVGGRNLFIGTNNGASHWEVNSKDGKIVANSKVFSEFGNANGIRFDITENTTNWAYLVFRSSNIKTILNASAGEFFTLSFDYKSDVLTSIIVFFQDGNGGKKMIDFGYAGIDEPNKWKHIELTSQAIQETISDQNIYIDIRHVSKTAKYVEIANLKLERGTVATDWTPAPEDVDSVTKSFTLSASSWSSGSYTISDSLITATSNQEVLPATSITARQMKALQKANIIDSGQSAGRLTLKALGTVPTIDIPIRVIFRGTI